MVFVSYIIVQKFEFEKKNKKYPNSCLSNLIQKKKNNIN